MDTAPSLEETLCLFPFPLYAFNSSALTCGCAWLLFFSTSGHQGAYAAGVCILMLDQHYREHTTTGPFLLNALLLFRLRFVAHFAFKLCDFSIITSKQSPQRWWPLLGGTNLCTRSRPLSNTSINARDPFLGGLPCPFCPQ